MKRTPARAPISANGYSSHSPLLAADRRQLGALAAIAQTMVAAEDYEEVLAAIIRQLAALLDAESGGFMLFDQVTEELVLQKPAFGISSSDLICRYRVPLASGGNAVRVFVTGQPYVTNIAKKDPKLLTPFADIYHVDSVITVPLKIEGRSIGVYHATNKRTRAFTQEDVELLMLIAPQLAAIIQLAVTTRQLKQHEDELERIVQAHNQLLVLLLQRATSAELTDCLAAILRMPVLLVEESGGITQSEPLGEPLQELVGGALLGHFVHIQRSHEINLNLRRLEVGANSVGVVPIVVGSRILGLLAAAEVSGHVLDDFAVRTLQQAALVFGLAAAGETQAHEIERRLHTDLLERLCVADSDHEAQPLLKRLGIVAVHDLRVAYLRVWSREAGSRSLEAPSAGVLAAVHRKLQNISGEFWPKSVAVVRGAGCALLLPRLPSTWVETEQESLESLVTELRSCLGLGESRILLAVGASTEYALDVRRSLAEAMAIVASSKLLPPGSTVVFHDHAGLYRLLGQPLDAADVQRFVRSTLGSLLEPAGEVDWLGFLEALILCNFNVKATGRRLGIHGNTARYRLARAEALLGVRLASPDTRLNLQIALKIHGMARADLAQASSRAKP